MIRRADPRRPSDLRPARAAQPTRIASAVLAAILLMAGMAAVPPALAQERRAEVILGGHAFQVEVVTTREKMARGLSGRRVLGPDRGMLFAYAEAGDHGFWMREMLIPIDMIWIHNHRIVHIEPSVPPPAPGTPPGELEVYRSPDPANFVLEIAAGRASELGVEVGDRVGFRFN